MNIRNAIAMLDVQGAAVLTRPYLMNERGGAYITWEDAVGPLMLRWPDGRCLAWTPSPVELLADDWQVIAKQ